MSQVIVKDEGVMEYLTGDGKLQFVLIGFPPHLASPLVRSTLNHNYGYGSTADHSICFARSAGNPDPFMQHAG